MLNLVPADILNRYLLIAENPIWPPMTTTTSTSCSPIIQIWHAVYHFQHFWGQGMQWKHLKVPRSMADQIVTICHIIR